MAKTYYGYKKREGLQAIDYLGAAKDLTAGLTGIFEEREKEREAIEEEVRKAEEEAKDVPMGDSSTLNEIVLDSSNGAAEALRAQAQLMRNGIIRPSEYTKFKQNTLDGIKDLKEGAASLNKNIADAKAAVDNETASVATMTFLEDAMKNTWFDRTRMYTDPKTGHLMIVRTDGKGKDIAGSETTMRNFKNQTKQIIDRYDVEKETSSFTKTLGEDVRLALKDPNIKTIKDALQKKTIDPVSGKVYTNFELIDQWVESITDADAASILVDELGGKYSATGDVNEKGKAGKVYYKIDPTAVNKNTRVADLTPQQRKEAEEYLRRNIYAQLDYVETPAPKTSSGAPSSAQIASGNAKEKAKGYVTALQDLFTAKDPKKRAAAMANLAGAIGQDRFISMEMNDSGDAIVFTGIDKDDNVRKTQEIPLEGTFDDFVKNYGKILTGTDDVWTYYDEVIDSPDVSSLTPSIGAGGKYEIGFEEESGQDLAEWTGILPTIPEMDSFYYTFSGKQEDATKKVDTFVENSNIKGVDSKLVDNNIEIGLDGKYISIPLDKSASTIERNIMSVLKKIYNAAVEGKPLEGTTGTKLSWADWKSQNPNGTFAEYNQYKNQ